MSESRTEKFDELTDNTALAQHLGDGEHEVRCRNAFLELARELYANDFRQQHGIWLPEHGRLGLDAANAPAEHGEAVDHSGVGIGTKDRVGISHFGGRQFSVELDLVKLRPHRARQVFEIDLVTNAGARRHHAKVVE